MQQTPSTASGVAPKKRPRRKRRVVEHQDWEEEMFPSMTERQQDAVNSVVTPQTAMYRQKVKKLIRSMGTDPATLTRKWKFNVTLTGIENLSNDSWDIFIAASHGHVKRPAKHKLREKFSYTRSYKVRAGQKKWCKSHEEIYNMTWRGSYKDTKENDVCLDVWAVSKTNFNAIIGSAKRTFYEFGNESVNTSMAIISTENKRTLGYIYVNVVLAELMRVEICASNWQFVPSKAFSHDIHSSKELEITTPRGPGQPGTTFRTDADVGPRYLWPYSGKFIYTGTKASLSMEAMKISVISNGKLQGKAIISMCTIGEYPIAVGKVKALLAKGKESTFIVGRVGGSLVVTMHSVTLDEPVQEESSSIPAPVQPHSSLVAFHLSPMLQYLIVDLHSADGLPVADMDVGSSNPFVRITYDGMVQQSEWIEGTLHPLFNHTFYLPVLVTDERIRTDKDFFKRLLPLEMQSKGYLEIEIWHWDKVPTDFLGGMKLDLQKVHKFGVPMQRSIVNRVKKARMVADEKENEDDKDEDLEAGLSGALTKKYRTNVYQARREKLDGSWLTKGQAKPTVSFDAYFIKPFDATFNFPPQEGSNDNALQETKSPFQRSFDRWQTFWPTFLQAYSAWFPDGPKEERRRFLCTYTDTSGDESPLPRLISPLALPASLDTPLAVQHWVRCMEFVVPPAQRSSGQIQRWQDPNSMLSLRRGSIQDHAVLLCCALIGLRKDAFVCKGTVQGGKEHAWVMTREQAGVVTFWETTTATRIHMAARWQGNPRLLRAAGAKTIAEERWKKRNANPRWMEVAAKRANCSRDMLMQSMQDLLYLPISPWKELYAPEKVVAVPYESIEVVFNATQAFGNSGNHHPTCVYYDMEDDPKSWKPLILEDQMVMLAEGQGLAIPVGPAISPYARGHMQRHFEEEIRDCIRIMRMRRGNESLFDESDASRQELRETLTFFVNFLERESRLDFDWCFDPKGLMRKPWGAESPFNSTQYVTKCRGEWKKYWEDREKLKNMRRLMPVKENHFLSGIPLHFSCTDMREIRYHILNSLPLQEYLNIPDDDVTYFVETNIVAMPASVASVWIFVGVEVPLSLDKIRLLLEEQAVKQQMPRCATEAMDAGGEPKKKKKKKGDWIEEAEGQE